MFGHTRLLSNIKGLHYLLLPPNAKRANNSLALSFHLPLGAPFEEASSHQLVTDIDIHPASQVFTQTLSISLMLSPTVTGTACVLLSFLVLVKAYLCYSLQVLVLIGAIILLQLNCHYHFICN